MKITDKKWHKSSDELATDFVVIIIYKNRPYIVYNGKRKSSPRPAKRQLDHKICYPEDFHK